MLTKTIETIPEEEGLLPLHCSRLGWKLLGELFSEDVCNKIREFKEKVQQNENTQEGCTLTPMDDKGKRKQVHDIVKRAFPLFTSDTTDDCVVLYSHKNQSGLPFRWPCRQVPHRPPRGVAGHDEELRGVHGEEALAGDDDGGEQLGARSTSRAQDVFVLRDEGQASDHLPARGGVPHHSCSGDWELQA